MTQRKPIPLTLSLLLLVLYCVPAKHCHAQGHGKKRDILLHELEQIDLAADLIEDDSWITTPRYEDRTFWAQLPAKTRDAYVSAAEQYLGYGWPVVKATDYLEIIRSGNRMQEAYAGPRAALQALVMGELVEGKGRFIDQIINGVWYYSEQTWWGWSAHFYLQKAPTVSLMQMNQR